MLFNNISKYNIVLASGSPRRQQLLKELGINFTIDVRPVKEQIEQYLSPTEVAMQLSRLKMLAFDIDDFDNHRLIITADTVVSLENEILGKPVNRNDAISILRRLSGKMHKVITGVTIKTAKKERTFASITDVFFKHINDADIHYYIDTYKPYDKAGAYGIQEWIGLVAIKKINGSYFNVMGLPTCMLYKELISFDI